MQCFALQTTLSDFIGNAEISPLATQLSNYVKIYTSSSLDLTGFTCGTKYFLGPFSSENVYYQYVNLPQHE